MNSLKTVVCAAAMALPGGLAWAEIDILPVTFTCLNGVPLQVAYFNAPDGSSAAAMMVDNQLVTMRQVQSGSGIRYESDGGAGTYILRSKGWDATVSYLATGTDAASEQVILENCVSR
ncbi:Membrane-bound lysozyme inhibitor of C-type lysozyme precursor [Ruegeria denitrificans]|uniref:Membrane-bound lysozyme inhibitor of C-type lysozyme n=1 Tax=Ruegeria denitrificans TaxID=1715692 RepID=A0A0N7M9A3_9RHOB|nr:MliC family protein [Ruegeria denitrificans]CUJ96463.1 Membrane-bound lysozyme inhibitor of C-type lysozyme precursor [Ruegeria denitrificans]